MRKYMRAFLACFMAVGMTFSSACDLLPLGNSSSGDSGSDSSISSSSSLEDFSSSSSSQEQVEYQLIAAQTSYSMLEEDVVELNVRLFINGAPSMLEGVVFASMNPDVATVDSQGKVTAVKEGKTVVTATIGSVYKAFSINVEKLVKSVKLDNTAYGLLSNGAVQVTAQAFRGEELDENATITYEIADESVATVTESGLLVGVGDGETTLTVTYSTVTVTVPVTVYTETTAENVNTFSEDYINIYGRTYITNKKLNLDHVASSVEVSIIGTSLTVELSATARQYIRVFVDGATSGERMEVTSGQKSYEVAKGLTDGYHKIRIVKVSELFDGQLDVVSFKADKFAVAPKKGAIKIEFIGDSITAGYAVLGPTGATRTVDNSDGSQSFAYKTAQKLGADYSTVAVQGICAKAYHWNKSWNMYSLYQNVSANFNSAKYDFSFNPDVIVLGLGTNEASYLSPSYGGNGYGTQFPTDYKDMLTLIRNNNPDAYIICVYGMMGTNLTISGGMKTAIEEMNDDKIMRIIYTSDTSGGHGHPSVSGNEGWATLLSETIKEIMAK